MHRHPYRPPLKVRELCFLPCCIGQPARSNTAHRASDPARELRPHGTWIHPVAFLPGARACMHGHACKSARACEITASHSPRSPEGPAMPPTPKPSCYGSRGPNRRRGAQRSQLSSPQATGVHVCALPLPQGEYSVQCGGWAAPAGACMHGHGTQHAVTWPRAVPRERWKQGR